MATTPPVPLIINNEDRTTSEAFPVRNPRNGDTVWQAYAASAEEVDAAAQAAQEAFPLWAELDYTRRRHLLNKAADEIAALAQELKSASNQETSAADSWATFEVSTSVEHLREAASRVSAINGDIPPIQERNGTALVYKVPYGVVLIIAPWNAAILLAIRAIAYALAAGNTIIFKSSELSPRTHFLVADAFRRAGFPPGVVNLVTHSPQRGPEVIPLLVKHPLVKKISFTGSTATGRIIARLAGEALKPVLLELGGKASAIILDDANLKEAAIGVLHASNDHAGQVCMATERVIVLRSVKDEFVRTLKDAFSEIYSNGYEPQPAIDKCGALKVKLLVENAIKAGATVVSGSADYTDNEGRVFGPTILSHVQDCDLYHEESFGPVLSLFVVDTIDEAIRVANDTEYGLAASVWSKNIGTALRVAKQINSGTLQINSGSVHDDPTLPHGGFGASGYGRFGGDWGISEFLTAKYIRFIL